MKLHEIMQLTLNHPLFSTGSTSNDWCPIRKRREGECCDLISPFEIATAPPPRLRFPDSSVHKESTCNAGDLGSIPGLGRSPGEGKGYPLQYSGLENSMDCIVRGVAKSQTPLSDLHCTRERRVGSEP